MLRRLYLFFTNRILLLICQSIVLPYIISYGLSDLEQQFQKSFQNKAVRIIGEHVKDSSDTTTCFKSLSLLSMGHLLDYQAIVFPFQSVDVFVILTVLTVT